MHLNISRSAWWHKRGRKRKERATTTQRIKIWKRSHGSPITIFSLYTNVYKHVYRDFTKDKKEYQDTICSKAKEGNADRPWEVLYDYVLDPAPSQPEWRDLWGIFTHEKNSPFDFSGVDEHWETYPSALTDTILCLAMIFAALLALSSVNEPILVRAKNSNGTTMRTFSNFNLVHGHCTLLPFPSALTSLCTPDISQ